MSLRERREKRTTENEKGLENITRNGTNSSVAEQGELQAMEVAIDFLKGFSDFDPLSYVKEFYPPMDFENTEKINSILEKMMSKNNGIDLGELALEFKNAGIDTEQKTVEALENYCIYHFFFAKVIPRLLQFKPDDHFDILDVGGGPTIYQHIPFLPIANSIIHAEYLQANRQVVKDWLSGVENYNWESFVNYCRHVYQSRPELFSTALPEVASRIKDLSLQSDDDWEKCLRDVIQQVIGIDVFKPDLSESGNDGYDIVQLAKEGSVELLTSNFCIESATADKEEWKVGLNNIVNRVKTNGFVLITAITGAEWYKVGEEKMPATLICSSDLKLELENLGCHILESVDLTGSNRDVCGYGGMTFVLAQKIG